MLLSLKEIGDERCHIVVRRQATAHHTSDAAPATPSSGKQPQPGLERPISVCSPRTTVFIVCSSFPKNKLSREGERVSSRWPRTKFISLLFKQRVQGPLLPSCRGWTCQLSTPLFVAIEDDFILRRNIPILSQTLMDHSRNWRLENRKPAI